MDELVLLFHKDGTAKCLYNEELELNQFGRLYTYRASTIEMNNNTCEWEVTLEDGTFVGSWESRQVAIQQEVEYLHREMMNQ